MAAAVCNAKPNVSLQGWQGSQTLPREVTLDAETGVLLMNPIAETAQLRSTSLFSGPVDSLQPAASTQACQEASQSCRVSVAASITTSP